MEALFIYLFKSAGILTIFFLAYKLLLQKETFFNLNRHYLLGGIVASLLLPLVVFKSYIYVDPIKIIDQDPIFYDTSTSIIKSSAIVQPSPFDWNTLLFNIYIIGIIIISVQFLIQLFSLYKIVKSGVLKRYNTFNLIEVTEEISPFSFFNYIIYNPESFSEKDLEIILNHEKAHGKQMHSIDILLSQVFVIFQWFNPIVWFYKKTIQQNLEFMADKEAISNIESKKNYQHTLLKTSVATYCTSITNNFYNSLIKKRIVMLNQTSSKTRNLWKYSLILPALALFLVSFNTKKITIVKDDTTTEFLVEPSSTNADLKDIENHFKSNKDVMLKFKNLKRNNSGELTSLSINTKYKKNNRFMKRLSFKPINGKKAIDAFKLNYDNTEQSFLLTRIVVGVPESKIMENTIKLLADFSISETPSKTNTSIGDNPLYIINGKKTRSNAIKSKQMSLDGEVIQLGKKEGKEQYGEEGKDGVLILNGKTSINSSAKKLRNDVIVKITKDTTKEELDQIERDLNKKGYNFSYSGVDFNSAGEITSIKIKYKGKESNSSGTYHVNSDDAIKTIYVYKKENGGFGIGNSPDGREHEDRMEIHKERLEDHKARMEEHKERMYEHKQRIKEHNETLKEEHEERMAEHRNRMDDHKAKVEQEHEVRLKEMKERHEEMKIEKEERLKEQKVRMKEEKERRKKNKDGFEYRIKTNDDNNGKKALFIVDGKIMKEGAISDLDPNEIASVNVLKGKAAINMYGDKGKDGVIQIVMKNKQSPWKVSYDVSEVQFTPDETEDASGVTKENIFTINKKTTKREFDVIKEKFASKSIDITFSKIKRNKQGNITRLKIESNNNKGSKSSTTYNVDKEGIPEVWIYLKDNGKVSISSSN